MTDTAEPQRFTDRIVAAAHSFWVLPALFLLEIAETTFVPFPYEAVFIALCLAARDRIWLFTLITVIGSAVAGAIMYALGAYFAAPVSEWLGVGDTVDAYMDDFAERGASLIFLSGTTPLPSYLVNFVAGASGYSFAEFLTLFSASRFLRFAILGGLIWLFGDRITRGWAKLPLSVRRILWIALLVAVVVWTVSSLRG